MNSTKAVKIGLLGLGTVGGGVVNVLQRNADEISRRAGRAICISAVAVRDLTKPRELALDGMRLTDDLFSVVDDDEIDIVVELIGGETVARDAVLRAIKRGKCVVTANKALIALHGNEIFELAQQRGVMVAFEAAVAGGIPIIKLIREGLAANRIQWIAGIINGTSNYILSAMEENGVDFADALDAAKKLGYAEADPTFDIDGTDAAHKLTILASLAFGIALQFSRVFVQGIDGIAAIDIAHARELGYRIKHLGIARRTEAGIELRVHPTLIPHKRLLANVNGVMNAVLVRADAVGATLHYGAGAGAEPTASSVVADLVDVVRAITTDPENRVPHLAFHPAALTDSSAQSSPQSSTLLPIDEVQTAYYLRLLVVNRPGVLAAITRIFGDSQISIDTILQKGRGRPNEQVSIIMLTQRTREGNINDALAALARLDSVRGAIVHIRLETLD